MVISHCYPLGHGADVKCLDWHPRKCLLASGSKDNQQPVKLWDPKMGQSVSTMLVVLLVTIIVLYYYYVYLCIIIVMLIKQQLWI